MANPTWKNGAFNTTEELIAYLAENSIKVSAIAAIIQDQMGKYHVIHKD
jgi:hypothetical protein